VPSPLEVKRRRTWSPAQTRLISPSRHLSIESNAEGDNFRRVGVAEGDARRRVGVGTAKTTGGAIATQAPGAATQELATGAKFSAGVEVWAKLAASPRVGVAGGSP